MGAVKEAAVGGEAALELGRRENKDVLAAEAEEPQGAEATQFGGHFSPGKETRQGGEAERGTLLARGPHSCGHQRPRLSLQGSVDSGTL